MEGREYITYALQFSRSLERKGVFFVCVIKARKGVDGIV
jgi:hypothetical protein